MFILKICANHVPECTLSFAHKRLLFWMTHLLLYSKRTFFTLTNTMSEMKFEFLPNEILLQCFSYLNIIHVFHSFDQLNHRFNSLIRNIPFGLNFENIHNKFQCEQFCMKLSNDETMKNQLYSLHLSNNNTCYPVHLFLSNFSLL